MGIVGSSPIVSILKFLLSFFVLFVIVERLLTLCFCFFLFFLVKWTVYYFCFFYNVRFLTFNRALRTKQKGRYRRKPQLSKKPLSLRKRAAGYNFRFKWFEYLTYFLSTLRTYENVNKFGIQIEKIVGREFLKE